MCEMEMVIELICDKEDLKDQAHKTFSTVHCQLRKPFRHIHGLHVTLRRPCWSAKVGCSKHG